MNRRDFLRSIGAALMLPGALAALPMARGGIVDPDHWSTKGLVGCWKFKSGAAIRQGDFLKYVAPGAVVPYGWDDGVQFFGAAKGNAKKGDYVEVGIHPSIQIKCKVKA